MALLPISSTERDSSDIKQRTLTWVASALGHGKPGGLLIDYFAEPARRSSVWESCVYASLDHGALGIRQMLASIGPTPLAHEKTP